MECRVRVFEDSIVPGSKVGTTRRDMTVQVVEKSGVRPTLQFFAMRMSPQDNARFPNVFQPGVELDVHVREFYPAFGNKVGLQVVVLGNGSAADTRASK